MPLQSQWGSLAFMCCGSHGRLARACWTVLFVVQLMLLLGCAVVLLSGGTLLFDMVRSLQSQSRRE
jgi:hypothetical protein